MIANVFMFAGSGCPADAPVLQNGLLDCGCDKLWCEDLTAVDYALLKKKGKKAMKNCLLTSLIQDTESASGLPWKRASAKVPWLTVFVGLVVAFAASAAAAIAWRSHRRQFPPTSYEEL